MAEPQKTTAIAKREPTHSERFAMAVERQFAGEVGNLSFTGYEKTLAQHLFIKIDAALAEAETKRRDASKPAIAWTNINMTKLAIDAVNRVQLGIDALIPGSLYPIAYYNDHTKKYDVDLRVGYKGELFYKMAASRKPIRNVRIELVYSTDRFTVFKAGLRQPLEGYEFEITQPFERGELVGGFGYIEYEDDKDNVLVVLSKAEIDKYRGKAKGDSFWGEWYAEMAYKTIVHRTTGKIIIDPAKINVTAMAQVEAEDAKDFIRQEEMPALEADAPALELPPLQPENSAAAAQPEPTDETEPF
ncbi:MAG: recombinase RecT [Candidatus Limiplasma sp.]|nr:recombinase RecT [Candidatus Limiplasma sp.]